MSVAGQVENMCHFASYIMYFQKVIVHNIPAGNFETGVIFFLYWHHFEVDVTSLKILSQILCS